MKLDTNTQLCISIAAKPSDFGVAVHNAAYEAEGLNFLYFPFSATLESLERMIQGVRDFGIRGCSVSMPFKSQVIQYLDEVDEVARVIGAVNTIVNTDGRLKGYNTDYTGAFEVLPALEGKKVLMLGAGGVAAAIGRAVKDKGGELYISNRNNGKAQTLASKLSAQVVGWGERESFEAFMLINATSVGMQSEEMPVSESALDNFEQVYDVIIDPLRSSLIKAAESIGMVAYPGSAMCIGQAAAQFKLYTGRDAPVEVMRRTVVGMLGGSK